MGRQGTPVARIACAVVVALALGATAARAQVTTGTVLGVISDVQGRPLPNAEVRVADDLHRVVRTITTDDAGLYRLSDLAPAAYEVTGSADGFRAVTRTVTIPVDTIVRVNLQLPLATVRESVTVIATAEPIQTTSGLGTVLDRRSVGALPLNGRHFLQLSLLTPGVQEPVESSELSSRGAIAMHANGAREEFNNFLLDGVDNNDPYVNRYVVEPPVDAVQEFKVATNGYSAEYGRSAGAQVNVITRRGSNQWQGFGYEYFRNRALNSRNYFDEGGKQPFNRNEFGIGGGGPLRRDTTFLFGTVNLVRQREGLSRLGSVPTGAERSGDLSALGTPVFNPFTGQPFAGNVIPASMIAPVARQVLALFPESNRTGSPNYLGQPVATSDQTQVDLRLDQRLSDAGQLTVRYTDGGANLFEPYAEGTSVTAGFGNFVDDRTWNGMAQYERAFSRATNVVRFGANGFTRNVLTENHQTNVGSAWGVSWLDVPPASFGYPLIDVAGYTRVGDAFTLPLLRDTTTYQLADDLTFDRGAHLVKVGGEMRHLRLNSQLDLFSRGQLSFTGALTGSGIGDLLLGLPTLGLKSDADNPIRMRTNAYAGYVQDDWRISSRLSVNLGLRYEYIVPPVDAHDGMTTFDLGTGELVQVGTNGVSRAGLSADRNNLAPRLAASWTVSPSTLVRGGYGLFYDSNMLVVNSALYFNPPQFNLRVFFPSERGLLTLDNPFPTGGGFVPPPTVSTLSPDLVAGYLHHWNLAVQHDVRGVGTVTAAYAASKGSHLIRSSDVNQPVPGPGDLQARRPYPAYSNILSVDSNGRSRYDSLQVSLDRPLTHHVSVLTSYTLSKSMDDTSAFLGTTSDPNFPQNSHDRPAEWAPSSYDVRHRLAMSYMIELPDGNAVTRGMQVQGITILHSGQPFTPVLRFDNSNTGNTGGSTAGSDRPNLVGDPSLTNPSPAMWFNTAAFQIAPQYTFGNAGRNSLRGPGYATFDLGVSKRLPMGETDGLTVGLQIFNLFNRANFDLPELEVDEPTTFGRIFSAKAPRQVQLLARINF